MFPDNRDEPVLTNEPTVRLLAAAARDALPDPDAAAMARLRADSAEAFVSAAAAPRRRVHPNRWLAAAAAVIALAAGLWLVQRITPGPAYAFADVPAQLRKVRTLHWRETLVDAYGHHLDRKLETITTEVWLDVDRGFRRGRYKGTAINSDSGKLTNDGENYSDDTIVSVIYHSNRHLHHWRANPLNALAHRRKSRDNLLSKMGFSDPSALANCKRTGNETIRGVACEVWSGRIPRPSRPGDQLATFFIDRSRGLPVRVEYKSAAPEPMGMVSLTIDVLEVDPELPPGFFRAPAEAPPQYTRNAAPEAAPMTDFQTSGFGSSNGIRLSQSFILPGGSLLVYWNSMVEAERSPKAQSLVQLPFGGDLPAMPATILGVRTIGVSAPEIAFDARYIGFTEQADGETFLWTLLVPNRPPPPQEKFFGYTFVYGPDPKGPLAHSNYSVQDTESSGGMAIENKADFDTFVLGVMAQLSKDGKAPPGVTYERVVEISRESRSARSSSGTVVGDSGGR
jgi:hypothetical protein